MELGTDDYSSVCILNVALFVVIHISSLINGKFMSV
jgi:hypothetical protein